MAMKKHAKTGKFTGGQPWNKGKKLKTGAEVGTTGTLIYNGVVSQVDDNPVWVGPERCNVIDEMDATDPTVHSLLLSAVQPLVTAKWYLKPGSDAPNVVKATEVMADNLFRGLDRPFSEVLFEAAMYLKYGCYVLYQNVKTDPRTGKQYWESLPGRHPNTLWKWPQQYGVLGTETKQPYIVQRDPRGGHEYNMDPDQCIVFVNAKTGSNWEGKSIFRSAWGSYKYKAMLIKVSTMRAERQGVGLPYMILPSTASPIDRSKAEELLRNLRYNEEAFYIGFRDEDGNEVKPDFVDMKAGSAANPMDLILHLDRQISKSALFQSNELGVTGGSFALGQAQTQAAQLMLNYFAKYMSETFQRSAIAPMWRFNNGPMPMPELMVTRVGEVDYTRVGATTQALVTSRVITPDQALEDYWRETLGFPKALQVTSAEQRGIPGDMQTNLPGTKAEISDARSRTIDPLLDNPLSQETPQQFSEHVQRELLKIPAEPGVPDRLVAP